MWRCAVTVLEQKTILPRSMSVAFFRESLLAYACPVKKLLTSFALLLPSWKFLSG
jgi:hypothetical protein